MDASFKIFIVEDDRFYGTLLSEVLKLRNFKFVKRMESGQECLESLHEKPDVIILDYALGDMNGVDLFVKIKKTNPDAKVVFLSAEENGKVAIKSLRLKAFEYFEKNDDNIMNVVKLVQKIANDKKFKTTGFFTVHHREEQYRLIEKYISLVNL